jgi:tape measure domain-containing protein
MAKNTERVIRITVDASKAKDQVEALKNKIKGFEKQTKKANHSLASMTSSINIFRTAMNAIVVGTGISAIAKMSDSYTNLNSRIKLVTKSEEDRADVIRGLNDISTRTYTDLEANATLFNRISTSMKEYNIQANSVLAVTEALSQTLRISGSTSQESKSGIIQFTQGLAKGKFDGDELKNILEGNIRLQRIFADAMGVSTSKLKELGAEGKITAEKVLPALVMELEKLREESKSISPTIGGALTVLMNNLTLVTGKILEVTKVSEGLAAIFMIIADNLHIIVPMIGTVLVGALVAAVPAISGFAVAFMAANAPMIALVASVGLVAGAVGLIFAGFWDGYPAFEAGLQSIGAQFRSLVAKIELGFAYILSGWENMWNTVRGKPLSMDRVNEAALGNRIAFAQAEQAAQDYWDAVEKNAKKPKITIESIKKELEDLIKNISGAGKGKTKKDKDPIGDRLKSLQDELEMMGRITKESQIQGEIINMTRVQKKKATNQDLKDIAKEIDAKQKSLDLDKKLIDFNKDIAKSQDDIGKAYQQGQIALAGYNELLAKGMITSQEFTIAQAIHMESYNAEIDKMQNKTVELTGFIKELHDAMDGFSQTTAEGLVDMTELLFQSGKGWADFGDIVKGVIKSIARDIAVMGTKSFVTDPLFDYMRTGVAGLGAAGGGSTYMGDAATMSGPEIASFGRVQAPSAPAVPSFSPRVNTSAKVNVVNVIDPAVVGEYLNTKEGEDTMVNVLSTSDSYKAI